MVFERISLIDIYDTLKTIETNERRVTSILINRSSKYGTKTYPRFENLQILKQFINDNYPYRRIDNPECECYTCNEGLVTLLNFTIDDAVGNDLIHVNNSRNTFESAKSGVLNKTTMDLLNELTKKGDILRDLYNSFTCYSYIQPQITYINPCEYIDFITNVQYFTLIDKYYKITRRPDFPGFRKTEC